MPERTLTGLQLLLENQPLSSKFQAQRSIFPVTLSFPSSCFIELCQSLDVLATDRLFVPKQYFRTSVVALYHEAHTN